VVKILMAVDGSGHDATTATVLGKIFKTVPDVEVLILHVANLQFPMVPGMGWGFAPVIPSAEELTQWEQEVRETARQIIAKAEQEARRAGLTKITCTVAWGLAADTIIAIAEAERVDLIALGSRGAGQVSSIFLGSVSDRVAHHAKVPVLIVR
jgi:nucleotide-binding universal stress UspA family protein